VMAMPVPVVTGFLLTRPLVVGFAKVDGTGRPWGISREE
jgi:hypothetical protein